MAASSLLTLLDDIATVLDDVAILTKVAAKKTAGVLGDDLALNAEQVSGVRAERELPLVWAVFKGSAINKLILVPAALAISAVAPGIVNYLLMLGGLYLCFEGVEKVWHSLAHKTENDAHKKQLTQVLMESESQLLEFEKEKIKGAIRTDFVLSAEIIVISLGTVTGAPFLQQVLVVSLIATAMTLGVYGLVALIVKLDDIGLILTKQSQKGIWPNIKQSIGSGLLSFCPLLMKGLSLVGTAAMFLVGGGILVHGIPFLHHLIEQYPTPLPVLASILLNFLTGVIAGSILVLAAKLLKKTRLKA